MTETTTETIIAQNIPRMTTIPANPLYVDVNTNVSVYGPEPLTYDQDAVLGAIYNIIGIRPGERLWLPEFGSNVPDILFDPIHEMTALVLRNALIRAIEKWEPRVILLQQYTTILADENLAGYWATIAMQVKGLQTADLYTVFLRRQHTG